MKALVRQNPTLQGGLRGKVAKALLEAIEEVVPEEAADHCFFLGYSRGVVTVGVDTSVYHHELQCFFVQDVLDRLRQKIQQANITKIRFEIAPRPDGLGMEVDKR